jgi:plastocyanin
MLPMKQRGRVGLRAAAIGALLAFGFAGNPGTTSQAAERVPVGAIAIGNFAFEPSTLTVPAGTVLSWVNDDDAPHTVIGTDPDSPIKSLPLDTGDRYTIALTKPGTYRYFCSLHPHMTGTVIVD